MASDRLAAIGFALERIADVSYHDSQCSAMVNIWRILLSPLHQHCSPYCPLRIALSASVRAAFVTLNICNSNKSFLFADSKAVSE